MLKEIAQKTQTVLSRFISDRTISAKTIIAATAFSTIAFFLQEVGINGLPEAIATYIAAGIGIESLGIILDDLAKNDSKTVTEEDVLNALIQAYENGQLDVFAGDLLRKEDLQAEIGRLISQIDVLSNVMRTALQYHEDQSVQRILQGVQVYTKIGTTNVVTALSEQIALHTEELATRRQVDKIIEAMEELMVKFEDEDDTYRKLQVLHYNLSKASITTPLVRYELQHKDNRKLNNILRELPDLRNTNRRENFLDAANLMMFVDRLDFNDTARGFAQQLVRLLVDYGYLPDGQLAFTKLLVYVRELVEGQQEDVDFIDYLLQNINRGTDPRNISQTNDVSSPLLNTVSGAGISKPVLVSDQILKSTRLQQIRERYMSTILAVENDRGEPIGTGFLAPSREGQLVVVTCAHVIQSAGKVEGQEVILQHFKPEIGPLRAEVRWIRAPAKVAPEKWSAKEDICILTLVSVLPSDLEPLPLLKLPDQMDHQDRTDCWCFGYIQPRMFRGLWIEGVSCLGRVGQGFIQLSIAKANAGARRGLSGSPLCDNQGNIVGMIQSTFGTQTAYLIPSKTIISVLSTLATELA